MFIIVGLGNPGKEYELTRHNTGRIVVDAFSKANDLEEFVFDKKINALKAVGELGKEKVLLILPETFMNKSGFALKNIVTSKKKAEKMIVIHDDVDLPLGKFKVSLGRGSAGHKGVESVMRTVKTKDFYRVRVGISAPKAKGGVKKPEGEGMLKFLMGKFTPNDISILKSVIKKIIPELESIVRGSNSR